MEQILSNRRSSDDFPKRSLLFVTSSPDRPLVERLTSAGWGINLVPQGCIYEGDRKRNPYKVALMDLSRKPATYQEAEEWLQVTGRCTKWIALTSKSSIKEPAVSELIRRHFYDYHMLPANIGRLLVTLGRAYGMATIQQLGQEEQGRDPGLRGILGESDAMQTARRNIVKMAAADAPVLITGESGTGKEVVARAIHACSSARRSGPFVAVNCGALPSTLIQSELFGHEKGAFTGAQARKIGKIEAADKGTIFLDEIGDLAPDLQVNLLRVLQEHRIRRVGSDSEVTLDIRTAAATNIDLETAVRDGRFRKDLYYRLNVLRLHLPPLRDRAQDIESLAKHFLQEFSGEGAPSASGFSQSALDAMRSYSWPGNIRELMNRVRLSMIMAESRLISAEDLGIADSTTPSQLPTLGQARADAEKAAVHAALIRAKNNFSEAARILDVTRATLYRLVRKHGLRIAGSPQGQGVLSEIGPAHVVSNSRD